MLNFFGSGALGDSVIIYAKLFNIIRNIPSCFISYEHFESNKKRHYETALNNFWQLVTEICEARNYKFKFNINFYPHREFYAHVPQKMGNKGTFLTTKIDMLCYNRPNILVLPKEVPLIIIADGGGGSRGIAPIAIQQICNNFNLQSVILGVKKIEVPHIDNVENLTGKTTLEEALQYVGGAKLVIGPDGILTYYAYVQKIPNVILFHERSLIDHYWSKTIKRPSIPLHQEGWLKNAEKVIEVSRPLL